MTADELVDAAAALGAEHGRAGGSWVFDGNTDQATYVRCLELDEEGAPEWFDMFGPSSGPLSGEWADGMTPARLADELDVSTDAAWGEDPDGDPELLAELCDAYEQAYNEAWRDEVLRTALYHAGTVVVHSVDHRGMTTSRCPRCGTQFPYWDDEDLDANGDLRCYCSSERP